MHMPSGYLPTYILVLCAIIAAVAIMLALVYIDKRSLATPSVGLQIAVTFSTLCGLYMLFVGTKPGMSIHWLGVMMTVMMFGPWLALLILSAVHALLAFGMGIGDVDTLGFNIVVCAVVPTLIAAAIHVVAYYRFPRTVPVYLIQIGVGDLMCMVGIAIVLTTVLRVFFPYPAFIIWQDFTLLTLLMGGMEAVISTWFASLLVCYLPSWLSTFSDEEYLHNK